MGNSGRENFIYNPKTIEPSFLESTPPDKPTAHTTHHLTSPTLNPPQPP